MKRLFATCIDPALPPVEVHDSLVLAHDADDRLEQIRCAEVSARQVEHRNVAERLWKPGDEDPLQTHPCLQRGPGVLTDEGGRRARLWNARPARQRGGVPAHSADVTRSAWAAMSTTTTPASIEAAYRIPSRTDRCGVVTRSPSTTRISSRPSFSALTARPACGRVSAAPVARVTGACDSPSPCSPLNEVAPHQRRAAQPVTAPNAGRTAAASTIRCSTTSPSTSAGTYMPRLVRRHRGPRACLGVGPLRPVGSVRTGATSPGLAGPSTPRIGCAGGSMCPGSRIDAPPSSAVHSPGRTDSP
jgi:hypothetical protein